MAGEAFDLGQEAGGGGLGHRGLGGGEADLSGAGEGGEQAQVRQLEAAGEEIHGHTISGMRGICNMI
jgi:hypothetical protein